MSLVDKTKKFIGRTFGSYTFVSQKGNGSFGTTYACTKVGESQQVAIKVIAAPRDTTSWKQVIQRMISIPKEEKERIQDVLQQKTLSLSEVSLPLDVVHECSIQKCLKHENIVPVDAIWVDTTEDPEAVFVFIVMPLAQMNLSWFLHKHRVPNVPVKQLSSPLNMNLLSVMIGIDIIQGMKYLWDHELHHLDIKPENILLFEDVVNRRWVAKIADFGLSCRTSAPATLVDFQGTFVYKPPETGSSREVAVLSRGRDVWALGLVLLELITFSGHPFLHCFQFPINARPETNTILTYHLTLYVLLSNQYRIRHQQTMPPNMFLHLFETVFHYKQKRLFDVDDPFFVALFEPNKEWIKEYFELKMFSTSISQTKTHREFLYTYNSSATQDLDHDSKWVELTFATINQGAFYPMRANDFIFLFCMERLAVAQRIFFPEMSDQEKLLLKQMVVLASSFCEFDIGARVQSVQDNVLKKEIATIEETLYSLVKQELPMKQFLSQMKLQFKPSFEPPLVRSFALHSLLDVSLCIQEVVFYILHCSDKKIPMHVDYDSICFVAFDLFCRSLATTFTSFTCLGNTVSSSSSSSSSTSLFPRTVPVPPSTRPNPFQETLMEKSRTAKAKVMENRHVSLPQLVSSSTTQPTLSPSPSPSPSTSLLAKLLASVSLSFKMYLRRGASEMIMALIVYQLQANNTTDKEKAFVLITETLQEETRLVELCEKKSFH